MPCEDYALCPVAGLAAFYLFMITFLPSMMFRPFCASVSFWPAMLYIAFLPTLVFSSVMPSVVVVIVRSADCASSATISTAWMS